MPRIHRLPLHLANQIAAGEVVERPASVVKELIENALDAQARRIAVTIEFGGKKLIRIEDDGEGMDAEDARLAIERHATSKIASPEDLGAIRTLGFRGEALPSIASVSHFMLRTRARGTATGTEVRVNGGTVSSVREVGAPEGTCIEVADLFYNLPARRKFLKSDTAEATQISRLVTQMALGYPETGFTLTSGGTGQGRKLIECPPAAGLAERFFQLFGERPDLIDVRKEAGGLKIHGYVAALGDQGPVRGPQNVFVNRRIVKDRTIAHAISDAYAVATIKERSPEVHLFIEIPPDRVDVNVHPTKAEVRFLEQSLVHEVLRRGLMDALGQGRAPELQFTPFAPRPSEPTAMSIPGVLAGAAVGNRWAGESASRGAWESGSQGAGGPGGQGVGEPGGRGVGEGRGAQGRGRGRGAPTDAAATVVAQAGEGGRAGAAPAAPTGRGGAQLREWYRGLPIPLGAANNFSRRNNTNYMQTGVLTALQLTSMFPNLVVENFYRKTQNSITSGKNDPPHGFVIPVQRDMTRVATLVNILRVQRIEVGQAKSEIKVSDGTFPAGSYVIKRDQPYGRLAKNLLERQLYPDPNLRTYDDSGWTMGLALNAEVKEIKDKAILDVPVTLVKEAAVKGTVTGTGSAALAIAHFGSNNMIALRFKLRNVPMKIADKPFSAGGTEFPAGSFVVLPPADFTAVRAAVEQLGLTAAALADVPSGPMHDADVPRIAMFSSWTGTQEIGWVRYTFDRFGIPYDLVYKERVKKGNLRADYDVIVMPTQTMTRQAVFAPPAARPVPYMKDPKYKFLGMYGESPDITGGIGGEGVDAFAKFLDAGGTLITMGNAARFPAEFGFARTVDASGTTSNQFYAPRPLVNAEILRLEHPVFYGYTDKTMPVKYLGGPLMTVAPSEQGHVLARYVGSEPAVLSGLMRGADEIRERPFAIDVPGGLAGRGRVLLFSNNPIYRWQNHGEFNMVFNAVLNWNDMPVSGRSAVSTSAGR